MNKLLCKCILVAVFAFGMTASYSVKAQNVAYFGIEPYLKISYSHTSNSKRLGYLCLGVELMLKDVSHLAIAEHHEPLIKSIVIKILGRQIEEKVKSIIGREEIRKNILKEITTTMMKETGNSLVLDIIYTRYQFNC